METGGRISERFTIDLNGRWEIEPGERESPPSAFSHQIEVPSLVDCASPAYDWESSDYHWYRRSFFVDGSMKGRPSFLEIDQSMFGTDVWVNENFSGRSISCYTSQEYRIDKHLKYGEDNEILVRIGQRTTLPPESAVGKDQERISFIPGIWGDVKLFFCGNVRVKLIQTIPHIDGSSVDANLWIENPGEIPADVIVTAQVREKSGGTASSKKVKDPFNIPPGSQSKVSVRLQVQDAKLWSPEFPFLYFLDVKVTGVDGSLIDRYGVVFGMREFRIRGSDFLLNGERIHLKGSNIAFHRFLSDADRRRLPWDDKWIRRALVDIPKEHNFNFFRAHLGHMYNKWYDIADEGGIMLQDEWQFWGTTGTKEQIAEEFSQWVRDNWNHPSIVIWDALNESSDTAVQNGIIPEMKKLDPTRPWESNDFFEDHPYIYTLGPVLVDRKFGYTRSLPDMEKSRYPSQVNEYLWWWLDKDFRPSALTKEVVSRWLGVDYTDDEVIEHQSFLAAELTELFRRLDVKSIQPFVYLSSNEGPTSHWFVGDIADLQPKPVLAVLKNSFEPFGVSIELWDRHFFQGESRSIRVHVFNDHPFESEGRLKIGLMDSSRSWIRHENMHVHVDGASRGVKVVSFKFPDETGDYFVAAELTDTRTERISLSVKIAHVYPSRMDGKFRDGTKVSVLSPDPEAQDFLKSHGYKVIPIDKMLDSGPGILLTVAEKIRCGDFVSKRTRIFEWVESGGNLILIQPESGVHGRVECELPGEARLIIEPRTDADRGGYDSYVIASDHSHPIWTGIRKRDLRMFNGGYGGEIIPQCDMTFVGEHEVLARSGLGLTRPVVIQSRAGKGTVLVSSMEILGRLVGRGGCYDSIFAPRPDPVARQFLANMIAHASRKPSQDHRRPDRFPVR